MRVGRLHVVRRATSALRPAVVLLWAGLIALAALSAAAAPVYAESGTECGGLVQPRDQLFASTCGSFYAQREDVVRVLLVLAAGLLLLAAVTAVAQRSIGGLRRQQGPADVDVSAGAAVAAGLLGPMSGALALAFTTLVVVVDPAGQVSQGLPRGWLHVGLAAGAVLACLLLRADRLSTGSSLAAAAVGVPALLLTVVVAGHVLEGSDVDTSARLSANPLVWAAAGVPLAAALRGAAARQRHGRAAPAPLVSAVLVLAGVAVTTVVLMPQLLPAYRDANGGGRFPSRGLDIGTWLPVMTAPVLLSLLVVSATSLRAAPNATAARPPRARRASSRG